MKPSIWLCLKSLPKPSFLKLWKRSAMNPAIKELASFEIHNAHKTKLTWRWILSGDPLKTFLIMKIASIWNASMHPFIKTNDPSKSLQFALQKIDLISSQKIFKSQKNLFWFEGTLIRVKTSLSWPWWKSHHYPKWTGLCWYWSLMMMTVCIRCWQSDTCITKIVSNIIH